jgi:hypothetical protein
MEFDSMSQPLLSLSSTIKSIARMLGKAVKFRHCPATVSAPALCLVVLSHEAGTESARFFSRIAKTPEATEGCPSAGFAFGKAAETSVSQETGPRRFQPLYVPRGTKELPWLYLPACVRNRAASFRIYFSFSCRFCRQPSAPLRPFTAR